MHRRSTVRIFALTVLCVAVLSAQAMAASLPQFADLAEKCGPAVVNVFTETKPKPQRSPKFMTPRGTPFDEFFDQFDQFFNQQPQRRSKSLGSGFLISPDGYILTNNHVVEKADKVNVKLQSGEKTYKAKVIGQDAETDLALIKIEAGNALPFLKLGDSSKMRVGDWVVAIGNPFGLAHTVTAGIISAKGRIIGAGPYDDFIQTDASINPGNSGGPLINLDGEVIGINTAIVASGQGIGFAVPSNMAKGVVAQLKDKGKVKRGMLGVTIQSLDENTAKALGLPSTKGALVSQVSKDGPADKAGLQAGDVIVELNGQPIADSHDLTTRVGATPPGETVKLEVLRKGKPVSIRVTLTERDLKQLAAADGSGEVSPDNALGMTLGGAESRSGHAAVVVSAVEPGSAAAEAGMRRGDIILQINQRSVSTPAEAAKVIAEEGQAKGAVVLLVKRQGQALFRTIPVQ
ncbi:DegQ family serine endoprotease [Fundidesulfovibrio butyratiphilus]